jgi:flagellar associated repeat protein
VSLYRPQPVQPPYQPQPYRLRLGEGSGDTTPPTLSSAAVPSAGSTLTATLSESGCTPSSGTGGFTLSGTLATVASWAISGTTLTLTLTGAVKQGETVTYSYARADTTDDIQDAASNFLADFSGDSVTNNSTLQAAYLDDEGLLYQSIYVW